MTADAGSSRAQSETHDKVRGDIADSDIHQVVETLHSALTVPYVNLNFGEQERYPKIDLHKPDVKNIEQIIFVIFHYVHSTSNSNTCQYVPKLFSHPPLAINLPHSTSTVCHTPQVVEKNYNIFTS